MAQSKGNLAETGIGRDERSALLGSAARQDGAGRSGESDPTQQVLLALGHFQRILQGARKGSDDLWSDECMNQLILGVEMALMQGWTQLVDAFTDAGRILQTYETAQRPRDAMPFLEGSYDLLCGIVGEMMGGGVRPQILDQWQQHYDKAVEGIREAGLTLVDDGDTGDSPSAGEPAAAEAAPSPFEFPQLSSADSAKGNAASELPTLDELPPLESMMPTASGEEAMEPEPAESALAVAAAPAPVLSSQGVEPSRSSLISSIGFAMSWPSWTIGRRRIARSRWK